MNTQIDVSAMISGVPRGLDVVKIKEAILKVNGVLKIHNLRIWCLTMNKNAIAVHVTIGKYCHDGTL